MALQGSAALVVACLLALQAQLAEPSRPELVAQALDTAGPSGVPHCKALIKGWVGKGGIPQDVAQELVSGGISCLAPCDHQCGTMLGKHQDFAALHGVAAFFASSSQGKYPEEKCKMGLALREKCLLQVTSANLVAVKAELKNNLGQHKVVSELRFEKAAITQWAGSVKKLCGAASGQFRCMCSSCAASYASYYMRLSGLDTGLHFASTQCRSTDRNDVDCESILSQCKCVQCFGGTNKESGTTREPFLLEDEGNRYMPETAGALRSFIQQYAPGACQGSCDYELKMFKGMQ